MDNLPKKAFDQALREADQNFVFITLSGSHLYGFPSADSDYDLRGAHLLPGDAFWTLDEPRETLELKCDTDAGLVETVTHDLRKAVRMLLKHNGYALEQITSPLVIRTSPVHQSILAMVPGLLTRSHYHHYRGFYRNERREYDWSNPKSLKKLLYCYRVLMTGCILLREGVVEANLDALNQRFGYRFLDELIERKRSEGETAILPDDRPYIAELDSLEADLDRSYQHSRLPEAPSVRDELNHLLVETRRSGLVSP